MLSRVLYFFLGLAVWSGCASGAETVANSQRTWLPAQKLSSLNFYREMPREVEYSEMRAHDGDDSRWSDLTWDDSDWRVLSRKEVPLLPANIGILWVRFRVRWNSPKGHLPEGVLFNNFAGSYDLYWDGVVLAHSGVPGNSAKEEIVGGSRKNVALVASAVGPGEHLVAIRLSTYHATGPWRVSPVTLVMITPEDYATKFSRDTILPMMAAGALLIFTVAALSIWAIAARRRVFLLFAGMCFSSGVFIAIRWYLLTYDYPYSWKYPLSLGATTASLAMNLCLVASVLEEWSIPRRLWWIAALLLLDAALFAWSLPNVGRLPPFLFGAAFLFALACSLWAVLQRKHGAWIVVSVVALSSALLWRDPSHFVGKDFFQCFLPVVLGLLLVIIVRLRADQKAAHELKFTAARLQIELLKKNLQPHFLMNTLTALAQTVEENPGRAVRLIDDLAEEFRTVARMSGEKTVTLGQELALCRAHLRVMRARTDVDWELNSDGVDLNAVVPPALFLTLIENGFSHQRPHADNSTFSLRSETEGNHVRYFFFSPGSVTADTDRVTGGTGLRYIRARLEESFPGAWSLNQGEAPGGWETVIEIRGTAGQLIPS